MPNPLKYKSVSLTIEAYEKLTDLALYKDRSIGRQLSRLVSEAYTDVLNEDV
jgi:hypothetical protein